MEDEMIAVLAARRAELEAARVEAEARLNSINGGIAEMDYLCERLAAQKAAREEAPCSSE